uniref:KTSC domain-containing protein n=1 Tax=Panagrellus redivivus TaxID=6233 RepID=A0A7E4USH1_PANRE
MCADRPADPFDWDRLAAKWLRFTIVCERSARYVQITDAECDDAVLLVLDRARDPEFSFLIKNVNNIGYKLTI